MPIRRFLSLLSAGACAGLLMVEFAETANAYATDDRWTWTATDGPTGAQGTAISLTWSIVPDGTQVPDEFDGYAPSGLVGFLDDLIGAGPGGDEVPCLPLLRRTVGGWAPTLETLARAFELGLPLDLARLEGARRRASPAPACW